MRLVERGHHPVAEPLHDLAAVGAHRRLDRVADVAQQVERRLVAGPHRPVREVDQVGEDDRQLASRRAAPAPRSAPPRPAARSAPPRAAGSAAPRSARRSGGHDLRLRLAAGRQRVAERLSPGSTSRRPLTAASIRRRLRSRARRSPRSSSTSTWPSDCGGSGSRVSGSSIGIGALPEPTRGRGVLHETMSRFEAVPAGGPFTRIPRFLPVHANATRTSRQPG